MARAGGRREGSGFPLNRLMGDCREASADVATEQPDRQMEVRDSRARPKGDLGAWLAGGISRRGSTARCSAAGNSAIAARPIQQAASLLQ